MASSPFASSAVSTVTVTGPSTGWSNSMVVPNGTSVPSTNNVAFAWSKPSANSAEYDSTFATSTVTLTSSPAPTDSGWGVNGTTSTVAAVVTFSVAVSFSETCTVSEADSIPKPETFTCTSPGCASTV